MVQDAVPTWQLKKSLLSIDQYAAREGVSRGVVEKCGEFGIVQIRRHRGKTFVVDMPLSPYAGPFGTAEKHGDGTDKKTQPKTLSEFVAKLNGQTGQAGFGKPSAAGNPPFNAARVMTLAKKLFRKAFDIGGEPRETTSDTGRYTGNGAEVGRPLAVRPAQASSWRASAVEIRDIQKELSRSRAELRSVRNELSRVRQRFETVRRRNCRAIERINAQIQTLTVRLNKLIEY